MHQHGCGNGACQGGATAAHDLHWQALARKWDCELLGPSYHQEDQQNCRLWCDPSPPPVPRLVKAVLQSHKSVELTWDADADFESGLQSFIITRDGRRIAQVPEKPSGRFGRAFFQSMSYHDTPEAPVPEIRFSDSADEAGDRSRYQVIAVNGVGLESGPAESQLTVLPP